MQWHPLASRGQCLPPGPRLSCSPIPVPQSRAAELVGYTELPRPVQVNNLFCANYCRPPEVGGWTPTWAACSAVVSGSRSPVAIPAHCLGAASVRHQHWGNLGFPDSLSRHDAAGVGLCSFCVRQGPVCRKMHVSWRTATHTNSTLTTLPTILGASQVPSRTSPDVCDPHQHRCSRCQAAKHTAARTGACEPISSPEDPGPRLPSNSVTLSHDRSGSLSRAHTVRGSTVTLRECSWKHSGPAK